MRESHTTTFLFKFKRVPFRLMSIIIFSVLNIFLPINQSIGQEITEVVNLEGSINESSGLIYLNQKLIAHNDSGGEAALYEIDTITGNITRTVVIDNATNVDWEDICFDDSYIYIGDFGNNLGTRQDLKIYRISIADYNTTTDNHVLAEIINFTYKDQDSFTSAQFSTNFDAEALISYNDSLYIFTKNWGDYQSNIYSVSKSPGTYEITKVDNINAQGLITGATYNSNCKTIMLTGYTIFSKAFIYEINGVNSNRFSEGSFERYEISPSGSFQIEGITRYRSNQYYITSEKYNTSPPKLDRLKAKNHLPPNPPTIGTITQPTIDLSTGSVVLQGLPSTSWIINPGSITGTGTSTTITGLASGTYTFTVTDASGYISDLSNVVVINAQPASPSPPSGASTQTFCENATVADLVATGSAIQWYDVSTGGSPLDTSEILNDNQVYYASQTIDNEESIERLSVTVVINYVTGGTIGNDQTYCYGSNTLDTLRAITLPTGSATNLAYQWVSSGSEEGYSAISYGTNLEYSNIDNLINLSTAFVDVRYKRITTSILNGVSCKAESNVVLIQQDKEKPVPNVSPLPDIHVGCEALVLTAPTASDNCGPIIGTTSTSLPILETTVITWTYTDGFGNSSSQTQNVIIDFVDNEPPLIPVLEDLTGECSVTVTRPITIDACAGEITGTTTDLLTYTTQGTHIVTWTFDDGNGNDTTATQKVIINKVTGPVPDILELSPLVGVCSISPTAPTASDYCTGESITATTNTIFPITRQGDSYITWIYTDDNGNITTQNQNVSLNDITPPAISDSIAPTAVVGCSTSYAPDPKNTVAELEALGVKIDDACTPDEYLVVSNTDVAIGTCPIIITREYRITDIAGNVSAPIYHIISIEESSPPEFEGSMDSIVVQGCSVNDAPEAETTITGLENLSGSGNLIINDCDNDADLIVSYSDSVTMSGPSACEITTLKRTYIITDQCGNSSSEIVQIITIEDTEAPQISGLIDETIIEGCDLLYAPPLKIRSQDFRLYQETC
ncbi:MAG: hypothetical protein JW857_07720 [Bacteroidales bacterium]|nr:hypothetical protein [Bacteroidales bacterium]